MTQKQLYKKLATISEDKRKEEAHRYIKSCIARWFGSETMAIRRYIPRNPRFYPKSKVRKWSFFEQIAK